MYELYQTAFHGPWSHPQNANAPQPWPLVVRCCEASHVDVTSHPTRGPGLWVWDTQTGLKKGKSGYGKAEDIDVSFCCKGTSYEIMICYDLLMLLKGF